MVELSLLLYVVQIERYGLTDAGDPLRADHLGSPVLFLFY
jgi:hypothetical protein